MSLLERYVFRKALVFSLASLVSLVLIVWIVQALQRVDIVRTSASATGNVFWMAVLLLPDLSAGVLPFALMIGCVQALNALNADSERAVIAAAGASGAVVLKPLLVLAAGAAALILFNSHVLAPAAQSAFHNGLRTLNADAITFFLQPGRFEEIQDNLVISVGDVHGSTVSGLFLSDRRDPAVDIAYVAREAKIVQQEDDEQSYLLLYDGQLHRKSVADGAVSIIEFQTYAFDLAELRPVDKGDWVRTSERGTSELFHPDVNDVLYQHRPLSFLKEIAQRFSDWLYPIAFALWAVAVAGHARTNRQGSGPAMMLGLTGALVLKAIGFVSLSLVERDASLLPFVFVLPFASVATSLLLILWNVNLVESRLFAGAGTAWHGLVAALRRLAPQPRLATGRTKP